MVLLQKLIKTLVYKGDLMSESFSSAKSLSSTFQPNLKKWFGTFLGGKLKKNSEIKPTF